MTMHSSGSKRVWLFAIAGATLAGLLSWGAGEGVVDRFQPPRAKNPIAPEPGLEAAPFIVKNATFAYGIQGAVFGVFLGVAGALNRGASRPRSAVIAGTVGLLVGGLAVACAAHVLFTHYLTRINLNSQDMTAPLLTHSMVWLPLGAAGGLAFGIGRGGGVAGVLRAVAGGCAGAIIGAAMYEVGGASLFPLARTGDPIAIERPARLLAHGCVDLFAAVGIALVLSTSSRTPARVTETAQ